MHLLQYSNFCIVLTYLVLWWESSKSPSSSLLDLHFNFRQEGVEWSRGAAPTHKGISWANLNAHEMENGFEVMVGLSKEELWRPSHVVVVVEGVIAGLWWFGYVVELLVHNNNNGFWRKIRQNISFSQIQKWGDWIVYHRGLRKKIPKLCKLN